MNTRDLGNELSNVISTKEKENKRWIVFFYHPSAKKRYNQIGTLELDKNARKGKKGKYALYC